MCLPLSLFESCNFNQAGPRTVPVDTGMNLAPVGLPVHPPRARKSMGGGSGKIDFPMLLDTHLLFFSEKKRVKVEEEVDFGPLRGVPGVGLRQFTPARVAEPALARPVGL